MPSTKTFWWTPAPFLRLLPALMLGMVLGWYGPVTGSFWLFAGIAGTVLPLFFPFLSLSWQYRMRLLPGASLLLLLVCLGGWLVQHKDVRQQSRWLGHVYDGSQQVAVILEEELVAKPRSFKAVARVEALLEDGKAIAATGRIILYFRSDISKNGLGYGSRLLIARPLQPIRNSGNPGAFDYQRYCLFQGITHQVFVPAAAFRLLPGNGGSRVTAWIIGGRKTIIDILRTYIGGKQEQGLAEALLIGYKDDLDKSLVQAYSNTGVVHVIAISGLHLGLIYGLLVLLLRPLRRRLRVLRCLLVVAGLWAFALLAGGQPSVLRSAVMFSCLALGELISRRTASMNTLALSAFGLLCFNPFWLWDLGFQLSYAAVAGILVFYQPLYRALYFPNRIIDWVWQLAALTLTAQVFTFPVSLYHFHQFPILFLLTNLLAVPLSSLILLGEILLCATSFTPAFAGLLGKVLSALIRLMNAYVLRFDNLSIGLWEGFTLNLVQVALLFGTIGFAGYGLLVLERKGFLPAWVCLLGVIGLRSWDMGAALRQQHLVVYNIPRFRAVDLVAGRKAFFVGDSALLQEGFERNFHLRPARTRMRVAAVHPVSARLLEVGPKQVLFYETRIPALARVPDVLVVSRKAAPPATAAVKKGGVQVVLDGTVPAYRRRQWRQYCDSVGWRLHDVQDKGAFVMKW